VPFFAYFNYLNLHNFPAKPFALFTKKCQIFVHWL
jgi:hypothetical protein